MHMFFLTVYQVEMLCLDLCVYDFLAASVAQLAIKSVTWNMKVACVNLPIFLGKMLSCVVLP